MTDDFRELAELLEQMERSSANMSAKVSSLRQAPTPENAQALIDELHALQKELAQLDKYFRDNSPAEMLDVMRAISDSIYGTTKR